MSSESKAETAYQSLTSILNNNIPPSSPSQDPASSLLHDPEIASRVSALLRQPNSGAEDDSICRWLYDTFQSNDPKLQLVAISFLPVIAGVYLSRVTLCKPLAGFEAVLLALYAHETTHRNGQPVTVNVPDLSHPSIYHESKSPAAKNNNNATDLNLAVISPSLEPHGTMRSTKRARIVGVTLELYYSKIPQIPVRSKIDFCEFCQAWAGQDGHDDDDDDDDDVDIDRTVVVGKEGRIPLPWELLQPVLRILGHCLLGSTNKNEELYEAACGASRSLYARALHDINPNAILATGSLLRLGKKKKKKKKNASDSQNDDDESEVDHTEIPRTRLISL